MYQAQRTHLASSLAILGVLALSSVAAGQKSIFRQDVPDFDQVRSTLPNTGTQYCVPTSAANFMAYLGSKGIVGVSAIGVSDWQAQINYGMSTGLIELIGQRMQTNSTSGTNSSNARSGLAAYLESGQPGRFTVSTYHGHVRLEDLYDFMADNRLILICYGRYRPNSDGEYSRNGGHCVSLTGMLDIGGNGTVPRIRYRDPGTDDGNPTLQSTFTSRVTRCVTRTLPDDSLFGGTFTRVELIDVEGSNTATRVLLDTHVTIRPRYAVYPSAINGSWVRYELVNSIRAQGGTLSNFATVNAQPIDQMALSPTGDWLYYTTVTSGPDVVPLLHKQNTSTGAGATMAVLDRVTPLTTDRFGSLYMLRNGAVRKYDASGTALVQQASFVWPTSVFYEALVCDDRNDRLMAAGPAGIQFLSRTLVGQGSLAWPSGVAISGAVRMDVTPAGTFVVGSGNSSNLFHVQINPVIARLDLLQTITLPASARPRAIQITEAGLGRLVVMTTAGVREYTRNPTTFVFEPAAPLFAAVPTGNQIILSKGRTNAEVGVHDTPAWNDVLVPATGAEIPTCDVDVDLSGTRTVADIFFFLSAWFRSDRMADWDTSGLTNVQDIFSYLSGWFAGC